MTALAIRGRAPSPWPWSLDDEHRFLVTRRLEKYEELSEASDKAAKILESATRQRGATEVEIAELTRAHEQCLATLSQKDQEFEEAERRWRQFNKKTGKLPSSNLPKGGFRAPSVQTTLLGIQKSQAWS